MLRVYFVTFREILNCNYFTLLRKDSTYETKFYPLRPYRPFHWNLLHRNGCSFCSRLQHDWSLFYYNVSHLLICFFHWTYLAPALQQANRAARSNLHHLYICCGIYIWPTSSHTRHLPVGLHWWSYKYKWTDTPWLCTILVYRRTYLWANYYFKWP